MRARLRWPDRAAPIAILASGLDHPEGVVWCAEREVVYAGGERGELYRVTLDGRVEQFAATGSPGAVLGLALDAAGRLYVCDEGGQRLLRVDPDTATIEVLSTGTPERPMIAPNYPVFERSGRLLVSVTVAPPVGVGLVSVARLSTDSPPTAVVFVSSSFARLTAVFDSVLVLLFARFGSG